MFNKIRDETARAHPIVVPSVFSLVGWGDVQALSVSVLFLVVLNFLHWGCSEDAVTSGPDAGHDTGLRVDAISTEDGAADRGVGPADAGDSGFDAAATSCHQDPGADDKDRFLVVSHPFDSSGQQDDRYEVVALAGDGTPAFTGDEFFMGRSSDARIQFTPDGIVGVVPQSDGSIGVFTLGADGAVTVRHAAFSGDFYASSLVVSPDGGLLYALDSQWRDNGGGIYAFSIACDGTLTPMGLVLEAQLPYAMEFIAGQPDHIFVYARDLLTVQDGSDGFLLSWGSLVQVISSAKLFPDDAIVASSAVTDDEQYVLVGDNCGFCQSDNRVGVMSLGAGGLQSVQVLSPLEDPMAIVTSPFDDAALVVSGFGNALFVLSYDPENRIEPFAVAGEVAYQGAAPQLPARAVMLHRGPLTGMVFVAENLGVRRLVFRGDGRVDDLGLSSSGSGTERVIGSIGVQP